MTTPGFRAREIARHTQEIDTLKRLLAAQQLATATALNRAEVAERRASAAERLAAEAAGDDAFAEELIRTNLALSKQLDALRRELNTTQHGGAK